MESDLLSIGKHCSVKECKQLDFLPFTCIHCKGIFCVNHRSYEAHHCIPFTEQDVKIATCPLCSKLIQRDPNFDLNDQVERHIMSGCTEFIVSQKQSKVNKCSLKHCRQYEVIPFLCQNCQKVFCARHRHMEDHNCINLACKSIAVQG